MVMRAVPPVVQLDVLLALADDGVAVEPETPANVGHLCGGFALTIGGTGLAVTSLSISAMRPFAGS